MNPQHHRIGLLAATLLVVPGVADADQARNDRDKPSSAAPAKTDRARFISYQLEAGVASTHVTRGVPRYDAKSIPSLYNLVNLRVRGLGPGVLSLGGTSALALAPTPETRGRSLELLPTITYGGRIGPMQLDVGARLFLFPRAEVVDAQYEGVVRASLPNPYLTPTLEIYPEVRRRKGAFVIVGLERTFNPSRWLRIRPRVAASEQGYVVNDERPHGQDVTASVQVHVSVPESPFYVVARPAYSVLAGPDRLYDDPSFSGRSVAYATVSLGVQR